MDLPPSRPPQREYKRGKLHPMSSKRLPAQVRDECTKAPSEAECPSLGTKRRMSDASIEIKVEGSKRTKFEESLQPSQGSFIFLPAPREVSRPTPIAGSSRDERLIGPISNVPHVFYVTNSTSEATRQHWQSLLDRGLPPWTPRAPRLDRRRLARTDSYKAGARPTNAIKRDWRSSGKRPPAISKPPCRCQDLDRFFRNESSSPIMGLVSSHADFIRNAIQIVTCPAHSERLKAFCMAVLEGPARSVNPQSKKRYPVLDPQAPAEGSASDARLINIGMIESPYKRHSQAPYAYSWSGKLTKDYKRLLAEHGKNGLPEWTPEQISRVLDKDILEIWRDAQWQNR